MSLRRALNREILECVRLYTYYGPVRKGKGRLMTLALRHFGSAEGGHVESRTRDGRRFLVDLHRAPGMYDTVYFLGEYERFITEIVSRVVRPGDVCLDVGANYGWYTTLLSRLCHPGGKVHAFEPVPGTFEMLRRNCGLAGNASNISLNNLGVSDAPGQTTMHVFRGLPHGHSSLSDMGRGDASLVAADVVTLDAYLGADAARPVNVVKVDVEGAELKVLKGASALLSQDVPPLWIIEMARETTSAFGYLPNEIIAYMKSRADYEFFAIDERDAVVHRIDGFAPDDIGANVLCVPAGRYHDRLAGLKDLLR